MLIASLAATDDRIVGRTVGCAAIRRGCVERHQDREELLSAWSVGPSRRPENAELGELFTHIDFVIEAAEIVISPDSADMSTEVEPGPRKGFFHFGNFL